MGALLQQMMMMAKGSTPPAGFAVWDAAKIPAGVTRTSDTVITETGTGFQTSGCTVGKTSGKWLAQITFPTTPIFVGVAAQEAGSGSPWGTDPMAFGSGECIAQQENGHTVYASEKAGIPQSTVTGGGHISGGNATTIALDLDSTPQNIKFFNGDTQLQSFNLPSGMTPFTWYLTVTTSGTGQVAVLNAGQSTIAVPAPLAGLGYTPSWG